MVGIPDGLKGDEIPVETRIGIVARDVDLFARGDRDGTRMLRERQGRAYDPTIVDVVIGWPNRIRRPSGVRCSAPNHS